MEKMKVLGTSGLNYYLENLLKNAEEKIILITPYIKLENRIKEILKNKKESGVKITIVCRNNDDINLLQNYSTNIYIRKNLHAKCYLTENEAIITSLNLYDFSQRNNDEMGVYIYKDTELYIDTLTLVKDLCKNEGHVIFKEKSLNSITEDLQIQKVEIVEGSSLYHNWKNNMQKITTNKGMYIDTLKDTYHKNNTIGCDWKQYINKQITNDEYFISQSKDYQWLNKIDMSK